MASILPRLLFLSLLIFHCILLVNSDEEDDLLRGLNQYRTSLNLPALTENDAVECLAGEIADRFQNQPCTNASGPNAPPGSEPQISSYPDLVARCRLNATAAGQILPVCVPRLQPGPVLSSYTTTRYAAYLNDSRFSDVGIASEDDWMIVVLTGSASDGSFSPGDDEEDNLLRGINQYRTSRNIAPLTEIDSVECFADDVADTFQNRPCTNATGPNARPGSEPKFSDYPSILAKCRLNPAQDGLILPVCVQPGPVLSTYMTSRYASYLNDTRFSGIGIGSEDGWVVVVLTSNGSFTPAIGGPGPSPGPGSGSGGSNSGGNTGNDEEDNLLRGINQYRTSRNISPLTEIDSVECFADDVADTFRNRPCTNATGPNARPGSEPKFSDYPSILAKCRLNPAPDGLILPACVQPGPVLSTYTTSRYASYLNDTRFSGIGIGSEDGWVVVVLTSNGSFTRASSGPSPGPGSGSSNSGGDTGSGSSNSGSGASGLVPVRHLLILVIGYFMFFLI